MPIYSYRCEKCKKSLDLVQRGEVKSPICCEIPMRKLPTFPAVVKIKGMGGYPSRRKFVKGTAPYTSRSTKAWLDEDPFQTKAHTP